MEQYGGEKKPKKTSKISSSKTRSKKGGNFLGTVGDLVAPTGWGPFVTAAGLLALDRADVALRRGTKEKKMKGGKKMTGGDCREIPISEKIMFINNPKINDNQNLKNTHILKNYNFNNPKYLLSNQYQPEISINCLQENEYKISIKIFCNGEYIIYNFDKIVYKSLQDAKDWLSIRHNQVLLIGLAINRFHEQCKNPNYLTAWEKSKLPKNSYNNGKILNKPSVKRQGILRTSKKT